MPEWEDCENEYNRVLFASPYREYLEGKLGPVAF
jgi:hypothetical protein